MDGMDQGFGKIAPRHAGLIGHDHGLQAVLIQQSDGLAGPGEENEPVNVIDISHLLIDGTVPVQKHSAVSHRASIQ
jgi:hypothetical protein